MKTLPSIPSELIRLALADLEKAEADPNYKVVMCQWHLRSGEICEVCLAGSVMAFSLDCHISRSFQPKDFDQKTQDKIYALNFFRVGEVRAGLQHLDVHILKRHKWPNEKYHICPYGLDKVRFKADMHQLANDLEKAGL